MNDMTLQHRLILDYLYEHERTKPDRVFLTQPVGGANVADYTWRQVMDEARRMAAHLRSRNFEPGARIAILSNNCAHFIIAELAIWMAGGTTVAIYPTEHEDTIRYILEHCGASLLFIGKLDAWERQSAAIPEGLPCIALPLAPPTSYPSWASLIAATSALPGNIARAPDDLALICYTSGSTGSPKGVMHSFARASDTAERIIAFLRSTWGTEIESRVLSYLPLAHVFERVWIEFANLVDGTGHVFFTESPETFIQDVKRARPTSFISVPRLWLKFQQSVFAKISPEKLDDLLDDPASGPDVARQIVQGLGLGDAVAVSSGSAPIAPELIRWYRRLGLEMLEGYGMTEDFAYSFTSTPERNAPGCVGVALPGVEARISEDGEILIKSPGQMVGYYKRPDLDQEAFTDDGFFRTGDKGELLPGGFLRITGRIKEMFKTAKGKYVAPAPIERHFTAHPMIESALVSGAGQAAPCAVVVLDEGIRGKQDDPAVRAKVEAELTQLLSSINATLPSYERLAMVVVASRPWTVENGFLTPTMKIKRNRIESAVADQTKEWYAAGRPVIWA